MAKELRKLTAGALPALRAGRPIEEVVATTMVEVLRRTFEQRLEGTVEVDYVQIKKDMDDLEVTTIDRLREALAVVRDKLLATTKRHFDPTIPGKSLRFAKDLRLSGFSDVGSILGEFLGTAYRDGAVMIRTELKSVKKHQAAFTPTQALRWLRQKQFWMTGVLSDKLTGDAQRVLQDAIKYGEPEGDTVTKLWNLFEPYIGDESVLEDGEPLEPYRLRTIVRTNLTEAYNFGRWTEAHDPDVVGFIDYMEYSAVMDEKTTEVCSFLNGKLIPMDEPEGARLAPPNHFNCRSILVPVPVGVKVNKADIITASEIGKAKDLIPEGFK